MAWTPLLVALHGRGAREAALLGLTQGFVAVAIGFRWLPAIIKTFGDLPIAACALIALVICIYSAGRFALLAWLHARAVQRGWPALIALPLAFAASEIAYPLLFPWYTAAQVHRVPIVMQTGDLGGPILVGLPLVLTGAALAELLLARREKRPVQTARIAIACAPIAAALLYGAWRMPQIERAIDAAPKVRVGIVQGNLPHKGAPLSRAIAVHRRGTLALANDAPDLVIWPETALSGIVDADALEAKLRADVVSPPLSLGSAPSILSGVMLRRGDALSNSAILFDGTGAVHGTYDKVHPLAIGERIPFSESLPALARWIPNAGRISPGAAPTTLPLGDHAIAVLICYEDLLPSYANEAVLVGHPDLLVNLTNDSWFGSSPATASHFALATLRAVEHRRFFVRAANSGISGFIDPLGRASGETPLLEPATRVADLRWMSSRTIYERIGDTPAWCAALLVLVMGFVRRDARRSRRV